MLLVDVSVVRGMLSTTQKRQLVEGLTEAVMGIAGDDVRRHTWVLIHELDRDSCGIAGYPLDAEWVVEAIKGAI